MIVYSATTNAFYDTKHTYSPPIPDDAIEIGYRAHAVLLAEKGTNDEWGPSPSGRPILRRRSKPAIGVLKANKRRAIRNAALNAINDALLIGTPLDDIRARMQALSARVDQAQTEDELGSVSWGA